LTFRSLALAAALGAVALLNAGPLHAAGANADTYRQLDLLMDVFEKIRSEYVEEVEDKEVLEAAINGMLASLDPHSSYLGPDSFRDMQVQTRGEYGGLGMEVTLENGVVKVVAPIDDTPASRAGLKSGDYITHIDGEPVRGQSVDDAVEKMRGPIGTPVTITVVRTSDGEDGEMEQQTFDVDLIRENITLATVTHRVEDDTIGYIRIRTFNEQTTSALKSALGELKQTLGDDLTGVVLDLRSNPGGLLDQAIAVSDLFLPQGEVVSTRGRNTRDTRRWHAGPDDVLEGRPVVVLVNAGSASASEIVAGALQDHRRATVLGDRTFGKGTVQTIIPLGAESALRLTTARYYTPSGRSIQELGIAPDIEVRQPRRTADGRIVMPRREADLRGHLRNEQAAPADAAPDSPETAQEAEGADDTTQQEVEPGDYQLDRALELLGNLRTVMGGLQTAQN